MSAELATIPAAGASALALPDDEFINVLRSSLFPGASKESLLLVRSYCMAAQLDPMQKPVHIVPMWDSSAGRMRDVIMPGINLHRTNAARTGQLAGISEPEFGPTVTKDIGGQSVTFPEWCKVVARRILPGGHIAEFPAREFWIENYAVKGGKEKSIAPNAMWSRRPFAQLAKCAEAQALRRAFPESCSPPTADEMEGREMRNVGPVAPANIGTVHDPAAPLPPVEAAAIEAEVVEDAGLSDRWQDYYPKGWQRHCNPKSAAELMQAIAREGDKPWLIARLALSVEKMRAEKGLDWSDIGAEIDAFVASVNECDAQLVKDAYTFLCSYQEGGAQ